MATTLTNYVGIILLPIVILTTATFAFSFEEQYYEAQFQNHNIRDKFQNDITLPTQQLINYIQTGKGNLSFFSSQAQEHMKDVRNLFKSIQFLHIIALILLPITLIKGNKKIILRHGSILTLIVLALLIVTITNFSQFFIKFHQIFFTNDLWQFAATDNLIQLFPEIFFFNTFLYILITSAVTACVGLGASYKCRI